MMEEQEIKETLQFVKRVLYKTFYDATNEEFSKKLNKQISKFQTIMMKHCGIAEAFKHISNNDLKDLDF